MSDWTTNELERIGTASELEIAPQNRDGSFRPYTPIWVVRVGNDLYVRSYRGLRGGWYRRAEQSHAGRIRAGGLERNVTFETPVATDRTPIDQAYSDKYGRSSSYVPPMLTDGAVAATVRLIPANQSPAPSGR